MKTLLFLTVFGLFLSAPVPSYSQEDDPQFTRQQKLRGSVTPERKWWDLRHYHLRVRFDPKTRSVEGSNQIRFRTLEPGRRLQLDLQKPLKLTSAKMGDVELKFEREGNVYWINFPKPIAADREHRLDVTYQGPPIISKNPPWSGGITWTKDESGNHFIASACQGIGSSVWWPCKDHGYDEPDEGMDISVTVPENLVAVSNGRLKNTESNSSQGTKTFHWQVTYPINSYCVNVNIGDYVRFTEKYAGEAGTLDMDYWVLRADKKKAVRQFVEAPRTIEAFEYWFGKYPFYEDSYKLVQVPYLGMEHQSSVTYGNGFRNGYRGTDLSGTGVGLKFDFIIVHESGHEWFGNNISMKDVADMWIHESFTNYSENLFVEYFFTQKEAEDYVIGCRKRVRNDRPISGPYNVAQSGSGDMYYKGGNMLHTIRHVIDNDIKWRRILRGLNETFRHQTVTTQEIEAYISRQARMDLSAVFDQYLRTTKIPKLVYEVDGSDLVYRYQNVVDGFAMPLQVRINDRVIRLSPTAEPQKYQHSEPIQHVLVNRNFYVDVKER